MAHHRGRREKIVAERTAERRGAGGPPPKKDLVLGLGHTIDLGAAPYTVPCPACTTPACSPCRLVRPGQRAPTILIKPHTARWHYWHEHPSQRVVPGETKI